MKKIFVFVMLTYSVTAYCSQQVRPTSARSSSGFVTSSQYPSRRSATAHLVHKAGGQKGYRSSCGNNCGLTKTPFQGLMFPLPSTSQPMMIKSLTPRNNIK